MIWQRLATLIGNVIRSNSFRFLNFFSLIGIDLFRGHDTGKKITFPGKNSRSLEKKHSQPWFCAPVVLVLWSCSALALWSCGSLAKAFGQKAEGSKEKEAAGQYTNTIKYSFK